jgi:hypothetical protein
MHTRQSFPLTPAEMEALRQAVKETIARAERVRGDTRRTLEECRRMLEQVRAIWRALGLPVERWPTGA